MNILITGCAGFIGFHLTKSLIKLNHNIIGIDNINNYYDVNLKFSRLEKLGINKSDAKVFFSEVKSQINPQLTFTRLDLVDFKMLKSIFLNNKIDLVINLAAQAGVRYSIENPMAYLQSNIIGFSNLIECVKHFKITKFIYASSSSVYGNNSSIPFKETDNVQNPVSLYAATKLSNELIAKVYSDLYNINSIGLRFFTVYGPWGRPDMAYFSFTSAIINDEEILIYNNGNLERDFTYIDDVVTGLIEIVEGDFSLIKNHEIFNIGRGRPVSLMYFVKTLEKNIGKKAKTKMVGMQPGDVNVTFSDTKKLEKIYNYKPETDFETGLSNFYNWYKNYYDEN